MSVADFSGSHPELPIARQCALVGISLSAFYGSPRTESPKTFAIETFAIETFAIETLAIEVLAIMRAIDGQFIETPWAGRDMRSGASACGASWPAWGWRHLPAVEDDCTAPAAPHLPLSPSDHGDRQARPSLVRRHHLHPDAAQIPVPGCHHGPAQPQGSVHGIANAIRPGLRWRLAKTREADFCIEALEEALSRFGRPGNFNTDQGSQFPSPRFTQVLLDAFKTGSQARAGIGRCVTCYNRTRPHFALGGRTPEEVHTACDGVNTAA